LYVVEKTVKTYPLPIPIIEQTVQNPYCQSDFPY
jgi:hypothetical protein